MSSHVAVVFVVQEELGGVAVPHLLPLLQEERWPLQDGGGHTVRMATWGWGVEGLSVVGVARQGRGICPCCSFS